MHLSVPDDPGATSFWIADGLGAIYDMLAERKLPFIPFKISRLGYSKKVDLAWATWLYKCTKLLPNGRCGDYENRPDLCRTYEPASDGLCVHYRGAEAGDPTVQF